MKNNILLFSASIQSGKTSTLLSWIPTKNNVKGILTPDINDVRMLYDIGENKYYPFETNVDEHKEVEVIGRFIFLKSAFKKAIEILTNTIQQKPELLIIDEIGKLELEDKGLEPQLSLILEDYRVHSPETKIIIVIRDYLLERAVEKYGFNDPAIIDLGYFKK